MELKKIIPVSASAEAQRHFLISYPWTGPLFSDPSLLPIKHLWHGMTSPTDTIYGDYIRHHQSFFKQISNIPPANAHELDSPTGEVWTLYSLGHDIEGRHREFVVRLLDQQAGSAVILNPGIERPKPAQVTVEYRRLLRAGSAVLCRGWVEKVDGRKIWAKAVVRGEDGEPTAEGVALYIHS